MEQTEQGVGRLLPLNLVLHWKQFLDIGWTGAACLEGVVIGEEVDKVVSVIEGAEVVADEDENARKVVDVDKAVEDV